MSKARAKREGLERVSDRIDDAFLSSSHDDLISMMNDSTLSILPGISFQENIIEDMSVFVELHVVLPNFFYQCS